MNKILITLTFLVLSFNTNANIFDDMPPEKTSHLCQGLLLLR
jgi:hypothetical protein